MNETHLYRTYEKEYSTVPNILIRHPEISQQAKMMWIYLDSHTNEYLQNTLKNEQILKENKISSMHTIRKLFNELENWNLAKIENIEIKTGVWKREIILFNPKTVLESFLTPPSKKCHPPLAKNATIEDHSKKTNKKTRGEEEKAPKNLNKQEVKDNPQVLSSPLISSIIETSKKKKTKDDYVHEADVRRQEALDLMQENLWKKGFTKNQTSKFKEDIMKDYTNRNRLYYLDPLYKDYRGDLESIFNRIIKEHQPDTKPCLKCSQKWIYKTSSYCSSCEKEEKAKIIEKAKKKEELLIKKRKEEDSLREKTKIERENYFNTPEGKENYENWYSKKDYPENLKYGELTIKVWFNEIKNLLPPSQTNCSN